MEPFLATFTFFFAGFLLGIVLTFALMSLLGRRNISALSQALKESETKQQSLLEAFSSQLSSQLHQVSLDTIAKSTDSMLKLAGHQLNSERELISHELKHNKSDLQREFESVTTQLAKVAELVSTSEKEKNVQLVKLSALINTTNSQTADLLDATSSLKAILANSQARGQLGERLAEDILRIAGFLENVNYMKQRPLSNGLRPDFTFLLPKGLILNMDVKFPIQNYTRLIEASEKVEKEKYSKAFLSDVRNAYKDLAERNYSESAESVDCVLLFIPHEQVFSFIMQEDPGLFEQGLKNRIITCSPMTLFAVLAVIRKAVDHFSLEKTSHEILTQIASFRKQWEMFCKSFQTMGKRIADLQAEYDGLQSTRTRLLDKQLEKLDRIQQDAHLN